MSFFAKRWGRALSFTAMLAVGAVCWMGCGGDEDGVGYGGLVTVEGEAWVHCYYTGTDSTGTPYGDSHCSGIMFKPNGTVINGWKDEGEEWYFDSDHAMRYSTKGNKLTVSLDGQSQTVTYNVSGKTLTMRASNGSTSPTYTKTKINSGGANNNNGGGGNNNNGGGNNNIYTVTLRGDTEYSFITQFSMDIDPNYDLGFKNKFKEGDTVMVFAGYDEETEFLNWTVTSGVVPLFPNDFGLNSEVLVFVMPAKNVTLTANWTTVPVVPQTYPVTILYAGESSLGAGFYREGETVTIIAGTKQGKSFDGWISDDVYFDDETSYITTFVMPDYPVTIYVNWADAVVGFGDAKVRFAWESAEQRFIQSIAANTEDVAYWYEEIFLSGYYNDLDATDYPYFSGNENVPVNLYSRTLHSETGSPYKGKYFDTYEGGYTAVATVEDRYIYDPYYGPQLYDIVANYAIDVDGAGGRAFFEIAFDVGVFLDGYDDIGWFDDSFYDDAAPPRLEKKKAAKLLKKLKKDGVTYYVFKRAAKR